MIKRPIILLFLFINNIQLTYQHKFKTFISEIIIKTNVNSTKYPIISNINSTKYPIISNINSSIYPTDKPTIYPIIKSIIYSTGEPTIKYQSIEPTIKYQSIKPSFIPTLISSIEPTIKYQSNNPSIKPSFIPTIKPTYNNTNIYLVIIIFILVTLFCLYNC